MLLTNVNRSPPPTHHPHPQNKWSKWDEETIAEHDKERGTRQKIDEPPTPYRYSESSDSDRGSESEWEKGSPIADPSASLGMAAELISPPYHVSGPTLSVADNWEALQAKLNYHQQLQERGAVVGLSEGLNASVPMEEVTASHGSVFAFPSSASAAWSRSHAGTITPPGAGGGEGGGSDTKMAIGTSPDGGNGNDGNQQDKAFKDKRAAHYNEFKLVQAMRAKMHVDEDEEDQDDDV